MQEARAIRSQVGSIDLAVDLTNTLLSAFFVRLLRPGRSLGAGSRRITSWLYDTWQPLGRFGGHLARKPWWVLNPLFAESDGWPSADAQLRPRILPTRTGREATGTAAAGAAEDSRPSGHTVAGERVPGMILLFPGAGWPQKRWPLDRFVALGELLRNAGRSAAMLFAAEEHAAAEEARRLQAGDAARGAEGGAVDLRVDVRVPDGPELLDLLSRAAGVVANDSGAAHLAAALGIPTVAVFGPTNPGICGPLGARVRVVRTDCPDRPETFQHHCHDIPAYPCDLDGLRSVGVDRVGEALQVLLAESEGVVPGVGWHAARSAKNDASRTME
jgi:ADP-heptose:LPS heptosyltransferase